MGAIYSGLVSEGSCILATNDIFGSSTLESAVVEVNEACGALLITAKGGFLKRFRALWNNTIHAAIPPELEGLSPQLAETLVELFEGEFRREPDYAVKPLPFILLLLGYDRKGRSGLDRIFMRNRVREASETADGKRYTTGFDLEAPVAAESLFYGHAELVRYWFGLFEGTHLTSTALKLLTYFSYAETQRLDRSIYPDIRMATLTEKNGFSWVGEAEMQELSGLASFLGRRTREAMPLCFELADHGEKK
jgi:hypothetical protein